MKASQNKPDYVDSIYFVSDGDRDFMATIKKADGEPWLMEYRFRYYVDDKAFDSEDVKNWYTVNTPDDSQYTLSRLREGMQLRMIPSLELEFCSKVDVVELQCYQSDPKFFFELTSRPWANVKHLTTAEAEAMDI